MRQESVSVAQGHAGMRGVHGASLDLARGRTAEARRSPPGEKRTQLTVLEWPASVSR
jgi:hypothetical protein